jgi:hypothetical protein
MTPDQHLQLAAFKAGFAHGADPQHARKRHAVDPHTHANWRQGFEAGCKAAAGAERQFRAGGSIAVADGRIRDALTWVAQTARAVIMSGYTGPGHERLRTALGQLAESYAAADAQPPAPPTDDSGCATPLATSSP